MTRIGITGHSNLTDHTAGLVLMALRDALTPYAGAELVGVTAPTRNPR